MSEMETMTTEEMVGLYDEESLLRDPVDIPLPLGDDDDLDEVRIDDNIENREVIEREKMDEGDREELKRVEEDVKKAGEALTRELEERLWKVTIGAGQGEGEKMEKDIESRNDRCYRGKVEVCHRK